MTKQKTDAPVTSGQKLTAGDTRFKPGDDWSGNANGRPKGSKHKLSEAFVAAMCEDFEKHGPAVIETVRTEKPADYLRVIASVIPKDINLGGASLDDMSDEELLETLDDLRSLRLLLLKPEVESKPPRRNRKPN